jgi:uncharacterized protein
MSQESLHLLNKRLDYSPRVIKNVVTLANDGASLPFIARYRKEMTDSLDEVGIAEILNEQKKLTTLIKRKATILEAIESQGKLTNELKVKIQNCFDEVVLEDLYLPYKQKRKTKATVAREYGLEPLAKIIMAQQSYDLPVKARQFMNNNVPTPAAALEGARHIIAEWMSENATIREITRKVYQYASIESKVVKSKKDAAVKYTDYFDYSQPLKKCPSHRLLAINRAEEEGLLRVKLVIDQERLEESMKRYYRVGNHECGDQINLAIADACKRLLCPSIDNEFRKAAKAKADTEAIAVFSTNAYQLLLAPPVGGKVTLALDPGFRTGCKVVVLSETGALLGNTTIYPHPPQKAVGESEKVIYELVSKYKVKVIAIGNGTAGKESYQWINGMRLGDDVQTYLVNEDGASIYSASAVAREEFPDADVTVRGAVSIGRRLMDPLAELVKIDPKSIGVGQYQHDVNQSQLKTELDLTVSRAVNAVGINLNTASKHLLTYVSGLGPGLASNIVQHREDIGRFDSRKQLLDVSKLGKKAYEQAAGFLRVKEGDNILDDTAVHPERYKLINKIAKQEGKKLDQLIGDHSVLSNIKLSQYVSEEVGMPTLKDIVKELSKPGLDPRGEAEVVKFDDRIQSINDLHDGMKLKGTVTNLTKFGAFVDVGIKEAGLLHISQIVDRFISDPAEVLSINQAVDVTVIGLDVDRKRISLSMKGG